MPSTQEISAPAGLRSYEEIRQRKTGSDSLGKTEFLNILAAQLANQDPLDPVSDTEFVAQLAQFSALEQMQALNAAFVSSQTQALIDKYVLVAQQNQSGDLAIYGQVEGIVRHAGIEYIMVDKQLFIPDQVIAVADRDGVIN